MIKSKQLKHDPVVAARAIAQAEVARHWPELADIEPTVAPRQCYVPDAAELGRLGTAGTAPAIAPSAAEYTFTFAGQARTPEGYLMPRVARVTVDAQRRVVKAIASK
ncbi:MAG: hypothetical protein ABIV47_18560 [Roseiflexaceae bacterium]